MRHFVIREYFRGDNFGNSIKESENNVKIFCYSLELNLKKSLKGFFVFGI